ncbi:MAG: tetratricopeptide repeat protein [Candidatus Latescibacterota bacterium]
MVRRMDALWIIVACFAVYSNSFENSFHYDDEHSIEKNIHLRDLGNWSQFFTDPSTFSVDASKGMFRPLLVTSFALNYAWGGYEVGGYHVVNVLIHAASACLLWALVGTMGGGRRTALFAGLLFALHPLASEPVNYISARSESLAGMFYLGGLVSFTVAYGQGREAFRYVSWICLLAGLLSKSSVITLPAALLLLDGILLHRIRSEWSLREAASRHGVYWLIALIYLCSIVLNRFLTSSLANRVRGMDEQVLTQTKALAYYGKLLIWPYGLNVEHQFSVSSRFDGAVFPSLLALSAFGLVLFGLYRKRLRIPLFASLWGLLSLLPVLIMPLNVLVNERRLYVPAAAFCLGLAFLLQRPSLRRYAVPIGSGLMLVFALLTFQRNAAWKNDFTLWEDALEKAPQMPRAHLYMGNAHKNAAFQAIAGSTEALGHWNRARSAFRRAIELQPRGDLALRALNNLGAVSFVLQDIEEAERAYRRAVELNPNFADALINLGTIYHERGRRAEMGAGRSLLEQSVSYYERALQQLPNHADAWANMGLAYADMGNRQRAGEAYERALFLNPRNPRLLTNVGNFYATLAQQAGGKDQRRALEQAGSYYRQAIRLNGSYEAPRNGLRYVEEVLRTLP